MQVVDALFEFHHQLVIQGGAGIEQGLQFRFGFLELAPGRAAYRYAAAESAAQRTQHMDIGGRAGDVIAGPLALVFDGLGQLGLDHVRQLKVFEEIVHEFFARQLEDEIVFVGLVAVAGASAPAAAAAARTVELVALLVFGIAGVDRFPDTAVGVAEMGLVHVLDRNRDFFAVSRCR